MGLVAKKGTHDRFRKGSFLSPENYYPRSDCSVVIILRRFPTYHGGLFPVRYFLLLCYFYLNMLLFSPFCGVHYMTLETHLLVDDMLFFPNYFDSYKTA